MTVCVRDRRPLLARAEIHRLLAEVWADATEWWVGRYVLMPDHLHLFAAPARVDALALRNWVLFWKSQASRRWPYPNDKPVWQTDFWDRQLRGSESYSEKWDYVVNNPVRAGLCAHSHDWPFQGELHEFRFHDG